VQLGSRPSVEPHRTYPSGQANALDLISQAVQRQPACQEGNCRQDREGLGAGTKGRSADPGAPGGTEARRGEASMRPQHRGCAGDSRDTSPLIVPRAPEKNSPRAEHFACGIVKYVLGYAPWKGGAGHIHPVLPISLIEPEGVTAATSAVSAEFFRASAGLPRPPNRAPAPFALGVHWRSSAFIGVHSRMNSSAGPGEFSPRIGANEREGASP